MATLVSRAWLDCGLWKDPGYHEMWDTCDWEEYLKNFDVTHMEEANDELFQEALLRVRVFEDLDFFPHIPSRFTREINPVALSRVGEPVDYRNAPFPITKIIVLVRGVCREGLVVKKPAGGDPVVLIKEISWRVLAPQEDPRAPSYAWSSLLMNHEELYPVIRGVALTLFEQTTLLQRKEIEIADEMTEMRKELVSRALLYYPEKTHTELVIMAEKTAEYVVQLITEYIPTFTNYITQTTLRLPRSAGHRRKSLLHPESSIT